MALTFKDVAEILKLIDASDCEEVSLELEGVRLNVRKGGGASAGPALGGASLGGSQQPQVAQVAAPSATLPAAAASTSKSAVSEGSEIRAPMVGSFFRRPSPDKPPFVEVGSAVKPGDPLCLIEVMKLYTTIAATEAGRVKQIAAEDGQLVEFDQLLFVIGPS